MKTMSTREFFHTPGLVKALRPGQSVVVTDKGAASFTVIKSGRRPVRSRAQLEQEAKEICPTDRPKVNFTELLHEAKRR
jgi:antitoxin (DNA-binding transcriptional repressor) of toxin-antitoxin stability system